MHNIILADAGNAGGVVHPLKMFVFGRCGEMLQKSPKPIRKSFASYKGGPSTKRMRMVRSCSAAWGARPYT